jgi:hypothetical protein
MPHYTLSHEPGVGFAADDAARYHRGLGVAVVTFGGKRVQPKSTPLRPVYPSRPPAPAA